jgi:hypothetical protein
MATRLALVPDAWEDPRLLRPADLTAEGTLVRDQAAGIPA